jgi:alanyl-tRNA synthetase
MIVYITATKDLDIDCNALLKKALKQCGGKGGGSKFSASGQTDNLQEVIEFILKEVGVNQLDKSNN